MISANNINKTYRIKKGTHHVLKDISYDFLPGTSVGILGRNGAGKSTFLRILGGSEMPDSGKIIRTGKVSWPLGFAGGFQTALSGLANLRFICRLYDEDYKKTCAFVEDFAELGPYMDMPVYTYSSGMRAKLAFGISMAFDFEFYLIDEVTAVGDAVFQRKSNDYFDARRKTSTLIVVSHSMNTIKRLCDKMLVLHEGRLLEFPDNEQAEKYYNEVCCGMVSTDAAAAGAG